MRVIRFGLYAFADECDRPRSLQLDQTFCTPPPIEHFNKLSREDQAYARRLLDIGHRITFVAQENQEGFGHAVFCAREWVGEEPFLLLLGDHLYASDSEVSCARQLLDVYDRVGRSVVGLKVTPAEDIHNFGCATGTWQTTEGSSGASPDEGGPEADPVLFVTEFYEKPELEYAREHLRVDGMADDAFLTVFGQYVLRPEVFDYLEENVRHGTRERGEFQLTSCLERLRREDGFFGFVVKGRRFDIGLPDSYRRTLIDFRNA